MKKSLLIMLLLFLTIGMNAATVDTISVYSASMKKNIKTCTILPKGYNKKDKSYPVLYMLPGFTGNYASYVKDFHFILKLADQYRMIVICPDAAYSSWFFDSPVDPSFKYETFIAKELIQRIDHDYNTIKNTAGRAICGLSMGGHGALYLAFKHPDEYGAAGSISGVVDIRPFPNDADIDKRLGTFKEYPENWEKNTVINLVDGIKDSGMAIIFDCGVDDHLIGVNRDLHKKMLDLKIPHDYTERPGGHNIKYWNTAILYQFLFFHEFFSKS